MDLLKAIYSNTSGRQSGLSIYDTQPAVRVQLGKNKATPSASDQIHLSPNSKAGIPAIAIPLTPEQQALQKKAQQDFGGQPITVGSLPKHQGKEWKFLPAPPKEQYGEDLAWIVAKNHLPTELKDLAFDPAVTTMAELAVINRYKDGLTPIFGQKPKPVEGTELTFLKGTLGVKVANFSLEGVHIKPGADLVNLKTENHTEVNLNASLPVNYKGKISPDVELSITQGLPNPSSGEKSHFYLDSRVNYDSYDNNLGVRVGIRKQFNRDESLALYGKYTKNFNANKPDDGGIGVFYNIKFD